METKDRDQVDAPPGDDPSIRYDKGREFFYWAGCWYQAGAGMPPAVKQAWILEVLRRDREDKKRRLG